MNLTKNEIKTLKKLKEKKGRKEQGLFLIEGYKLCLEALNFGVEILKTIVCTDEMLDFALKNDFNSIYFEKEEVLNSLSEAKTNQGIICVAKMKCHTFNKNSVNGNSLVLDALQDPGNVGTLIRTASAFNFNNIFLLNSVDIYSEKVLRSAMGGIFKLNIYTLSYEEFIKNKTNICDKLIVADMKGVDISNYKISPSIRYAIIVGNEGNGVSNEMKNLADDVVKIKMNSSVESLNVAIAGSIIMHQFNINN